MTKVILSVLLILTLIPVQSMGQCKESVTVLEMGQEAPCTGFLLSPEAEQKASEDASDAEFYKALTVRLEHRKILTDKEIGILDKRLQIYIEQSEVLAERVSKRERQSKWEKVIWFGLGIIVTGAAVSGAKRL